MMTKGKPLSGAVIAGIRLCILAVFLMVTNAGFSQRVELLVGQERWGTLAGFLGIWGLSALAIAMVVFQANVWLRGIWAIVIALTTAATLVYRETSGSNFGVLDAFSLWSARHEVGRALDFYGAEFSWFLVVLACSFIVLAMPPIPLRSGYRRSLASTLVPVLPIALIAGTLVVKDGGGSQALPGQFASLSVGLVAGYKISSSPPPQRNDVAFTWRGPFAVTMPQPLRKTTDWHTSPTTSVRHIVIIVDESIRADYIDWTLGNPYTPELARNKNRLVDFGPAASGGNCSHYANAILRFAAAPEQIGRTILSNPTIWQYAKRAGFRTVYVDAQAAFNKHPGKLQNFMTVQETKDIDAFYALDENVPTPQLDDKLFEVVLKEVSSSQPVLIYANKNGAHFPYDLTYPKSQARFVPTMRDSSDNKGVARINSYRNAVRWSVDRLFGELMDKASLADTLLIYTSDHGQAFNPNKLSHCSINDPDPREALVPLFVATGFAELRERLSVAAQATRGHASHFSIAPTVLELMGYSRAELRQVYGPSLLEGNNSSPRFTSGDVFGLFSEKVRWHSLDLSRNYLEHPLSSALQNHASEPAVGGGTGTHLSAVSNGLVASPD